MAHRRQPKIHLVHRMVDTSGATQARENVARILLGAVARRGQAQQREADPSDNVVPAELSKPQEAHVSNGGSMPPLKRRER